MQVGTEVGPSASVNGDGNVSVADDAAGSDEIKTKASKGNGPINKQKGLPDASNTANRKKRCYYGC
jgi:hypothetical protein